MSVASLLSSNPVRAVAGLPIWRQVSRSLTLGLGYTLMGVGAVGAVLPGHLGAPILAVGLVVSLRASYRARRQFIGLQRQHPKILFPVRRLLRREPEVIPVAWQAMLRSERMILPKRIRFAGKLRRRWRGCSNFPLRLPRSERRSALRFLVRVVRVFVDLAGLVRFAAPQKSLPAFAGREVQSSGSSVSASAT